MTDKVIAIGELSRQTSCNIETVRYYERIGLLPKADRRGRYRIYGKHDVKRLLFIKRARNIGFKIDEVRILLSINNTDSFSCAQAHKIAESHLKNIKDRLVELHSMEKFLTAMVLACEDEGHVGCPLIDTLSKSF